MRRRLWERTASEAGRSARPRAGQEGLLAPPLHYSWVTDCAAAALVCLASMAEGADVERVGTEVARPSSAIRLVCRSAKRDRPFQATAYVKDAEGQTVRLELPPGVQLVSGGTEQIVRSEPGKKYAVVSWTLKGSKFGEYKLKVVLSDGTTAEQSVTVYQGPGFD